MTRVSNMLHLYCWILGDSTQWIFSIEISDTKNVSALKDVIKEKKRPEFDHLATNSLTLWQVHISVEYVDAEFAAFPTCNAPPLPPTKQ